MELQRYSRTFCFERHSLWDVILWLYFKIKQTTRTIKLVKLLSSFTYFLKNGCNNDCIVWGHGPPWCNNYSEDNEILLFVHSSKAESKLVEKSRELESKESILKPNHYILPVHYQIKFILLIQTSGKYGHTNKIGQNEWLPWRQCQQNWDSHKEALGTM